jgi:hypothetical protein
MKVNDIPMVPLAALERAQGELKSAYCEIADLHADIEESCQDIDRLREQSCEETGRLRRSNDMLQAANKALAQEIEARRAEKVRLVQEVARLKAKKGAKKA